MDGFLCISFYHIVIVPFKVDLMYGQHKNQKCLSVFILYFLTDIEVCL